MTEPFNNSELLSMLDTAIGGKRATYVASPITTGVRYLEWRSSGCSPERVSLVSQVIVPNCNAAREFAEELRKKFEFVINPAAFYAENWAQDDYHSLWRAVIDRFVVRVVLSEGWYLSLGCCLEFYQASSLDLEILTHDLTPIDVESAERLIALGISQLKNFGVDVSRLENLAASLQHLGASGLRIALGQPTTEAP